MEMIIKDLSYKYKNKLLLDSICINFNSSDGIIGIVGESKSLFMEILDLRKKHDGDIILHDLKIDNSNINEFRKKIALITQDNVFFTTSVKDEINFIIKYNKYDNKNLNKKIEDSFTLVGLDKNFLSRKMDTLSDSETFLFKLACNLIYNPDVIMVDDSIELLDHNSKKIVLNLFKRLNSKKNKIVIIASNDVNFIYQYCNMTLILNGGTVIRYGKSDNIFKDLILLENNNIDVPYLVQFTNLAKDKGIKLCYHRDILDLIKDVYRHV